MPDQPAAEERPLLARDEVPEVLLEGSSPDDLTRFVAEAKVTAPPEHPNNVLVHERSVDEVN